MAFYNSIYFVYVISKPLLQIEEILLFVVYPHGIHPMFVILLMFMAYQQL